MSIDFDADTPPQRRYFEDIKPLKYTRCSDGSGAVINEHGVRCLLSSSGSHFGLPTRDGYFRTNIPCLVPECCISCNHYDDGETGDFGEQLSGPYCMRGVFWPTRKGSCRWHEK